MYVTLLLLIASTAVNSLPTRGEDVLSKVADLAERVSHLEAENQDLKSRVQPTTFGSDLQYDMALLNHCPAGMENGFILDHQITASSYHTSSNLSPQRARLNTINDDSGPGAWCPAGTDNYGWIQVDLGQVQQVTGIITQGRHEAVNNNESQYIKSFRVSYGEYENNLQSVTDIYNNGALFEGNSNRNMKKVNFFAKPVMARYIRISSQTWQTYPCMRFEVLSC